MLSLDHCNRFIGKVLYSWFTDEKSEAENCYYQGSARTLDY